MERGELAHKTLGGGAGMHGTGACMGWLVAIWRVLGVGLLVGRSQVPLQMPHNYA